jgi:polysaccharide biosynthesis/export protein
MLAGAPAASEGAVLRPGDVVRITVWRRPELSGEFAIDGDGTVEHPLYRALRMVDIPLNVAEARLKAFLKTYEAEPSFSLEALLRVTVAGEVTRPNVYQLRPETSIGQAVAMAGGPTPRARLDHVRLLRDGRTQFVDLAHPGVGLAETRIRSGDQIQLDVRRSVFREYVAPAVILTGSVAAIINVVLRSRNHPYN